MNEQRRDKILATICYLRRGSLETPETLFLRRDADLNDFQYGLYVGLGGKIKNGERPEEGVKREVFEESGGETSDSRKGLHINKPLYNGMLLFDNQGRTFQNGALQPDWYVHIFTAREFSGELGTSKEGTLLWIPHSKVDEIEMHEGDRIFVRWLDGKGIFSARFRYEDKTLTSYDATFYLPSGEVKEEVWVR